MGQSCGDRIKRGIKRKDRFVHEQKDVLQRKEEILLPLMGDHRETSTETCRCEGVFKAGKRNGTPSEGRSECSKRGGKMPQKKKGEPLEVNWGATDPGDSNGSHWEKPTATSL